MSRTQLLVAIVLLPLAGGAAAQSQHGGTAEEALEAAATAYGPPAPEPECEPQQGDEIVVCAREQEQSQFRIRTDDDAENDYARETMNKGDPKAPDVAGPGIFRGKATVGGLCLVPPCPPAKAYMIDFDELPDTPAGSDAERVGQGLAPRGEESDSDDEQTVPRPGSR